MIYTNVIFKIQASINMAPFDALYGRPCRSPSCWIESGNPLVLGPDMILEASERVEEIRRKMKIAQDRQKKYADRRRRKLEFAVDDQVFLKVSPLKNVVRFGKKGKLAPRFVGPFRISERIGPVAYRIGLPEKLAGVHDVFHVSHLRKCIRDPSVVIPTAQFEDLEVEPNLTIERKPLRIVDRSTKQLRKKQVNLVKVQWSEDDRDCTWETEDSIRASNPDLFISGTILFQYCLIFLCILLFSLLHSFSRTKSFE